MYPTIDLVFGDTTTKCFVRFTEYGVKVQPTSSRCMLYDVATKMMYIWFPFRLLDKSNKKRILSKYMDTLPNSKSPSAT